MRCGTAIPKAAAAPATVSGELRAKSHWADCPGRRASETIREPGDLPSSESTRQTSVRGDRWVARRLRANLPRRKVTLDAEEFTGCSFHPWDREAIEAGATLRAVNDSRASRSKGDIRNRRRRPFMFARPAGRRAINRDNAALPALTSRIGHRRPLRAPKSWSGPCAASPIASAAQRRTAAPTRVDLMFGDLDAECATKRLVAGASCSPSADGLCPGAAGRNGSSAASSAHSTNRISRR